MQKLEDRSFRMNLNAQTIETAFVTDLDALKQRIFCILSTERNAHIILRDFGVELNDIIGSSKDYAYAVLTERIKSALMEDDCVTDVSDFEYINSKSNFDNMYIRFKVHSIFGEIEAGDTFNV